MLKKFGQTVLDYFLINYPNTSSFRLSVDDYTFSQFALMAGINEKEIISKIKTKYVHISFDLDVIKPSEFPAVNVCVDGTYQDEAGLTINMVKKLLKLLLSNLNVCSMDIVEYNPLLDKEEKCKEKVKEILLEIKEGINDNSK